MKTYLLIDEHSSTYWYARREENKIKPDLVKGMAVGDRRAIPANQTRFFIERET